MHIFVTGGTGFIGGALIRTLLAQGDQVTAIARDPDRAAARTKGARWVGGDLARADGLDAARPWLAEVDAVAHLAAVRRDWALGDQALGDINVASGPRLVEALRPDQRLLFVSSVAVYGHGDGRTPLDETAPFAPTKRYGASKVEGEAEIRRACLAARVPLTIARPGIVYGPGDLDGMVANLIRLVARRRFLLVGPGTSRANFLYIDDLTTALAQALVAPAAANQDMILAGPDAVAIATLVATVAEAVHQPVPGLVVPEALARLAASVMAAVYRAVGRRTEPFLTKAKIDLFTRADLFSTEKAKSLIGFRPTTDLGTGVRSAVAWLQSQGEIR